VTLLLVSQAPLGKLHGYKQRMGWSLPWVSAANTDFNFDFGASCTAEQVRSLGPRRGQATTVDSMPSVRSRRRHADAFSRLVR
jgi:predicted dithiol-disulfide oxidoreductase (DUF899 family)